MPANHPYPVSLPLGRLLRERAVENDAAADVRRKNYELDQHRIDRVREALGAATETEAITRALDLALEMSVFADEVRRSGEVLYGKGGVVNRFDHEDRLDFSGFVREAPVAEERPARRPRKSSRG